MQTFTTDDTKEQARVKLNENFANVSQNKIAYVDPLGNDTTGQVGSRGLPFATLTAAYAALSASSVACAIHLGIGSWTMNQTAAWNDKVALKGQGPDATFVVLNGDGAAGTGNGNGRGFTGHVSNLSLTVNANGYSPSVTSAEGDPLELDGDIGNGGPVNATGWNANITIHAIGGGNSITSEPVIAGNGGNINLRDFLLVTASVDGGHAPSETEAGYAGQVDLTRCDLCEISSAADSLSKLTEFRARDCNDLGDVYSDFVQLRNCGYRSMGAGTSTTSASVSEIFPTCWLINTP